MSTDQQSNTQTFTDNGKQSTNDSSKKLTFKVDPIPFEPLGELKIMDGDDICIAINNVFTNVFNDFFGAVIDVKPIHNPNSPTGIFVPSITTSIYFKVMKREQYLDPKNIMAFNPHHVAISNSSYGDRLNNVFGNANQTTFKHNITNDGKDVLKNYILRKPMNKNKDIDWNEYVSPYQSSTGTLIQVKHINLLRLLETIYGNKNSQGSDVYYEITPHSPSDMNSCTKWSFRITRTDKSIERDTMNILGFQKPPVYGLNIVTKTR